MDLMNSFVPPNFRGASCEDGPRWFETMEWFLQTQRAAHRARQGKIGHVALRLQDEAKLWFEGLRIVDPPQAGADGGDAVPVGAIATFAAFKELFLERFKKEPNEMWREISGIWGIKQGVSESGECT